MFVLSLQRGRSFELLAASDDIEKLRNKMKDEVLDFLSEVYGNDEEAFDWLMPITDDMVYWSDEDEEYPTIYRIQSVDTI